MYSFGTCFWTDRVSSCRMLLWYHISWNRTYHLSFAFICAGRCAVVSGSTVGSIRKFCFGMFSDMVDMEEENDLQRYYHLPGGLYFVSVYFGNVFPGGCRAWKILDIFNFPMDQHPGDYMLDRLWNIPEIFISENKKGFLENLFTYIRNEIRRKEYVLCTLRK